MELKQYFSVLIKWWWLILASVVIASVASYLGTLATPRQYQSRTTLMVGQSLQNPNPDQSQLYMSQALAQSYTDLVKREPVLRGTLEALKLDWDWLLLQSMVAARVVPGTQLLEITVLDTDPQRVAVLANEIAHQLILQTPAATDVEREAEHQFILQQVQDLKANITSAQSEIRQLDTLIAQATSARQIQDARGRQLALQTQVSTWQATYAQLLTSLQGGATNFLSVVEPAREPGGWIGATTASNILLAASIGFMLAASAAYLLEYLDDTVKTPDDVRKVVNLPTLGGVGRLEGTDYAAQLITVRQPRSSVSETYRSLRTNIQFSTVDEPIHTLMVTSASPGDGKTITAANLAVTLAQSGQRVVLVDTDLRRPSQYKVFGLPNTPGLTTILMDPNVHLSDVLQTTEVENLRVMTGGPTPPNPSEMLGSKRMGYLIEALQQETEIVVFDSPPLLAVTDGAVLGARLDGVVIVAELATRGAFIYREAQKHWTPWGRMLLASCSMVCRRGTIITITTIMTTKAPIGLHAAIRACAPHWPNQASRDVSPRAGSPPTAATTRGAQPRTAPAKPRTRSVK